MSKVTYLLGAGASYGERYSNSTMIKRGLPIVGEIAEECQRLIASINHDEIPGIKLLKTELQWLYESCVSYPTIDTYARQLFVTHQNKAYHRLKKVLSAFFMLEQFYHPHDLRYDGFVASIIHNDGTFPPINILTWNYDSQLEIVLKDYLNANNISEVWGKLGVINKSCRQYGIGSKMHLFKLNGTAYMHQITESGVMYPSLLFSNNKEIDFLSEVIRIYYKLPENVVENELSYAWDVYQTDGDFKNDIKMQIKDTEKLVIIGYSFPYVNREMDRFLFDNMPDLSSIVIQDQNYEAIKEKVGAICLSLSHQTHINYTHHKDLCQFYIPF